MHALYLLSVLVHVLAATTWIGGMLFLVLVVVPWMRSGGQVDAARFLRETGTRFRNVGWTCFALLLATGTFNLWVRGVRLDDFTRTSWLTSTFGRTVVAKLVLFTLVLVASAVHDFVLGPKATAAIEISPTSALSMRLRKNASLLGRMNVLFAFLLVALAIVLVRGAP